MRSGAGATDVGGTDVDGAAFVDGAEAAAVDSIRGATSADAVGAVGGDEGATSTDKGAEVVSSEGGIIAELVSTVPRC